MGEFLFSYFGKPNEDDLIAKSASPQHFTGHLFSSREQLTRLFIYVKVAPNGTLLL